MYAHSPEEQVMANSDSKSLLTSHPSDASAHTRGKSMDMEQLVEGDPVQQPQQQQHVNRDAPTPHRRPWQPGVWNRFPWVPVLSLLGSTLCAIGGIIVLITSDKKSTSQWDSDLHLQPAVYLAILSVLANIFLVFALAKGLVISFWTAALDGCTLADLHYIWDSGTSLFGAFSGVFRKKAAIVSIACIFTVISVGRGPLNQRATSVQSNHKVFANGSTLVNIAQILPDTFGGYPKYSRSPIRETARLTPNLTQVLLEYSQRQPINLTHTDCDEQCDTTVKGFGFRINCTEHIEYDNFPGPGDEATLFASWASLNWTSNDTENPVPSFITLNARYHVDNVPTQTNSTTNITDLSYKHHYCDLHGGITAYRLNLTDNLASFQSSDWRSDSFEKEVELLGPTNQPNGGPNVIGGFQKAIDTLFNSSATFLFGGAVSSTDLNGNLANQYVVNSGDMASNPYDTFTDPMEEMLTAVRELSLRASIAAANEAWSQTSGNETALTLAQNSYQQNVTYQGMYYDDIYATDRVYLAISALVSLLGIVAVGATFWGYWHLGRNVSLSPLEIANAFDADVLRHLADNAESATLAKYVKSDYVRYGEKDMQAPEGRTTRLRFVRGPEANRPYRNTYY